MIFYLPNQHFPPFFANDTQKTRKHHRWLDNPALFGLTMFLLVLPVWTGCYQQNDSDEQKSTPALRNASPNVLVITIDTLRADHLRCYGYMPIETPHIDALARRGYLFEQAFSTSPITAPSHATIFTGTYPTFHGLRDNGNYVLARDNLTLAEIFKEHGYTTAAFVSSFVLDRRFGLNQGFDTYNNDFTGGSSQFGDSIHQWLGHHFDKFERNAALTNKAVLPWLREHGQKPFFLWVHYYDPHLKFTPPEPWASRYRGRPYDGEIAFVDDQLGRLIEELDKIGAAADTLLVFVADHGEGLGQHEKFHGYTLFDPLIRVPLIVVPPGRLAHAVRVERQVRTIDILPTVLDFVGINIPEHVQGENLRDLMEGSHTERAKEAPVAYSETHLYERPYRGGILRGIRTPRWKYVTREREGVRGLYNLANDPQETRNVFPLHQKTADDLQQIMDDIIRTCSPGGKEVDQELKMDKETTKKLEALGYIR